MTDEIIVTLRTDNGFERDFALPANVNLGRLYPRLLAALQNASTKFFGQWESLLLETQEGALLDLTATLSDYGICTGCYLTAMQGDDENGIG